MARTKRRSKVPTEKSAVVDNSVVAENVERPSIGNEPVGVRPFDALVQTKILALSDVERGSLARRLALYAEIRAAYIHLYPNNSEMLTSDLVELNRSIERLEASLQPAPNWLERKLESFEPKLLIARTLTEKFKVKYGFLAVIATTAADFLKPFFEFTTLIMVASAVIGSAFVVLARFARPMSGALHSGAIICSIFFLFSFSWWSAQRLIPGAQAKGALVETIPGISRFQNGIVAMLKEIKGETSRVGDILEENARQERARYEQLARIERERVQEVRSKVVAAGYTLDSAGFASAVLDNQDYLPIYRGLGIDLSEESLRERIKTMPIAKMTVVGRSLQSMAIDYPFTRGILNDLRAVQKRMDPHEIEYYRLASPEGKALACNAKSYMMKINAKLLATVCTERDAYSFNKSYKIFLKYASE